jgi:hypothetical protein
MTARDTAAAIKSSSSTALPIDAGIDQQERANVDQKIFPAKTSCMNRRVDTRRSVYFRFSPIFEMRQ